MSAIKRINGELKKLYAENLPNITAKLIHDDIFKWEATIIGPSGTPYEGGRFRLSINLPKDYPFKPPKIKFISIIYHPNVSKTGGNICLDILSSKWSPALNITKVLLSISSLLSEPNASDPLNGEAGKMMLHNPTKFNETVRTMTKKYAS